MAQGRKLNVTVKGKAEERNTYRRIKGNVARSDPQASTDVIIDKESPRPGQQSFEKMIAGLYLGELFRLIMLDLHGNPDVCIFEGQDVSKLQRPYSLDSSFLSLIEE